MALYADRHTIFHSPKKASLEQELVGERTRSQFGRLVDELGIELIQAYSPQARGRIEQLFGTLQDRLVKELRRAGARTLEQADQLLVDFLPRFNARFAQQSPQPEVAYRAWPAELDPDSVFCFKHPRTVANDNTVAFNGHRFQIPPDRYRGNYARCQVEVRQHLHGRLSLGYQGRQLVCFDPAENGPPVVGKFTPSSQLRGGRRSSRRRSRSRVDRWQNNRGSHPQIIPGEDPGQSPPRGKKTRGDKFTLDRPPGRAELLD